MVNQSINLRLLVVCGNINFYDFFAVLCAYPGRI